MSDVPLHFLRPFWLFGLIPLLALWYMLTARLRLANSWQSVCDPELLNSQLTAPSTHHNWWPSVMLLTAWIFIIIALSGPSWHEEEVNVFQSQLANIVVLDLSDQMLANDIKPNRLTRARYKTLDLLKKLADQQTGMVVYTGEAFVVSPLTEDSKTIAAMVPSLQTAIMPVGGQSIQEGLILAQALLQQANQQAGHIYLITSGPATAKDIQAANHLRQAGYTLSVLGIGTSQGAPIPSESGFKQDNDGRLAISRLDSDGLNQLASAGGGTFVLFSNTDNDINQLSSLSLNEKFMSQAQQSKHVIKVQNDGGYWFVLAVIPLLLLSFRKGWLEYVI